MSPFILLATPRTLNDDATFAEEVEKYNEENVYFARSNKPRTPRPSSITFNVGDTVRHTLDGYHGVIIGWDANCKVINNVLRSRSFIGFLYRLLKSGLLNMATCVAAKRYAYMLLKMHN